MTKRFAVPRHEIDRIVGNYHVGTSPEVIAANMQARCAGANLTTSQTAKCVAYALKSHQANLSMYQYVMGGCR